MLNKEIFTCKYRRCSNTLEDKRKGAKYCSNNCRNCENKYFKREEERVKKEQEYITKLLKIVSENNISDDTLKLYQLIHGK